MRERISRKIIYIVLVVFILCQAFIRFNTALLKRDLDETIWAISRDMPSSTLVQNLTHASKQYGNYENAYDSSLYYMLGAILFLILFNMATKKEK